MEGKRIYRRRGTPDLPVAVYIGVAGQNMDIYAQADYHPEVELMLQLQGSTTMQIDGKPVTFHPGQIMLLRPNQVHRRIWFSDDAVIHSLVFSTDAIGMKPTSFFQKDFVKPLSEDRVELPMVLEAGHPAYEAVYGQMLQLDGCRIYEKGYKQRRLQILMCICLALMPHCKVISYETPLPDPGHEGVKLCMRYLHNHHTQKVTLAAISEYCHLHPNYLSAIFRRYTGEAIFEHLTRIRLESAQRLLLEDLPISKVAELSGFHSECLFYRKFKEHTGMTPKAYAKKENSLHKRLHNEKEDGF